MARIALDFVGSTLRSAGGAILNHLGVGGIIAAIATLLLLATLSAKAMKALSSRRGMAVIAGVLVIGLALMWWS